ncbi:hypothetical protein V1478_007519 [Vespula squamosa]|uniref:Uncharacterized protein n=1 Tax=Vespula squamosa TaxID=30214 RepID=A0ABD2B3F7_VESSQ
MVGQPREGLRVKGPTAGLYSDFLSFCVLLVPTNPPIRPYSIALNEASTISELRIRILGVSSTRLLGDRATTSNYIGLVSPEEEEENCENALRSKGHRPDNLPTNLAN